MFLFSKCVRVRLIKRTKQRGHPRVLSTMTNTTL
jgi:hypothetical protein